MQGKEEINWFVAEWVVEYGECDLGKEGEGNIERQKQR